MLVRLLVAFLVGVVAYLAAHLLFNHPVAFLIGVVVGVVFFFSRG